MINIFHVKVLLDFCEYDLCANWAVDKDLHSLQISEVKYGACCYSTNTYVKSQVTFPTVHYLHTYTLYNWSGLDNYNIRRLPFILKSWVLVQFHSMFKLTLETYIATLATFQAYQKEDTTPKNIRQTCLNARYKLISIILQLKDHFINNEEVIN